MTASTRGKPPQVRTTSLAAMRKRAARWRRASVMRRNEMVASLHQAAEDVQRLAAEVERLRGL